MMEAVANGTRAVRYEKGLGRIAGQRSLRQSAIGQVDRTRNVTGAVELGAPNVEEDKAGLVRLERGVNVPAIGLETKQVVEMCQRRLRIGRRDFAHWNRGLKVGHRSRNGK